MKQEQNLLDWLNREEDKLKQQREKDKVELDQQKKQFNLVYNPSDPQNPEPSSTFIDSIFQKMFF